MTAPEKGNFLRPLVPPLLLNAALAAASDMLLQSWVGWTGPGRDAYPAWLGNGLPFLQFMAVAFLVNRLFRAVTERMQARHGIPRLALQLVTVIIYFAFLGSSVSVVFGESVGGVLAASGIVGLAVGFALRGLLADVFSGIALHLDNGLKQGDWIDLTLRGQAFSGRLVDIQWRTVVLADRAENLILVPNSEFATAVVTNRSRPHRATEYSASLAVGSQYDRARVMHILENALARAVQAGALVAQPAPYVRVAGLDGAGAVNYRLFYCLDPDRTSPSRGQSAVLSHAVDFLKAANMRLHPVQHGEWTRPAAPGIDRLTEAPARLGVLADVPLLAVLSQGELAQLADRAALRYFMDGQQVMRAGEDGESMVVVVEGRLGILAGGQRVATLWPGDCAGEMSLLTGSARSADVQADGPALLLEVPKQALTPILQANPLLVERIAAAIAKRKESGLGGAPSADNGSDEDEARNLMGMIRRFFRL